MIQEGTTPKENFLLNKKMFENVKPSKVNYVFLGHVHADHSANIPALYRDRKCTATIIVPSGSTELLKEMWSDSAYISARDAEYLSRKSGKEVPPLYTKEDAIYTEQFIKEFDSHTIYELDDNISFRYTPAGHILLSQQTELFIKIGNNTKKIIFTSDLGNPLIEENKVFVERFEPLSKANIVIGECTYASPNRGMTKKTLQKDIEKIKTVIDQFCIEGKRRVLIPSFALDRTPYMLWILYNLFGSDSSFDVPIIIDSPLAIRYLEKYSKITKGEMKEKFDKMMEWKNIRLVVDPMESRALISENKPKIILSSSGMLTAGRSVKWVKNLLPHKDDCILFVGYCSTNTLAHKIKNSKNNKTITIDGLEIKNNCQIVDLHSFSSHMQREQLINYYKTLTCEKVFLVHGNKSDKDIFKKDLEKAILDCCKTTKVVSVNRSTKIKL